MAETFYIKQNDTSPILVQTLTNAAGTAVDVTGGTVNIHVNDRRGVNVVDAAATINVAASGIVQYQFAALSAGVYEFEFEVTFADSSVQTFPNVGFDLLIVDRDLA